jgi:hypothetical protein
VGPVLVYVHGIGNKPPLQELKKQWDDALFGHSMSDASRMAYWAPLRYSEPLPTFSEDRGRQPHSDSPFEAAAPTTPARPEEFMASVLADVGIQDGSAALESTDGAGKTALLNWLRTMTYEAEALEAGETNRGLEVLPLPRSGRTAVFRLLIKRAFKDAYAYFFGGLGEEIRQVMREALVDVTSPVVVVGHSLGSVIAYDVLREHEASVPLLLTIGSPLGVTEIQDRLAKPLEVPAEVAAWRNACDARDVIALDKTVRPEFAPSELTEDVLVVNDSPNHHGALEYLHCRAVRDPVQALVE